MAPLVLLLMLTFAAFAQDATFAREATWSALDAQAESSYNKGDLAEAIRIAKQGVAAAGDIRQSAHSLDRLGFFEYTSGDLKSGEASLRQAESAARLVTTYDDLIGRVLETFGQGGAA